MAIKKATAKQTFRENTSRNGKTALNVSSAIVLTPKEVSIQDFSTEDLLKFYRNMATARRLDEKMFTLLKQGKGYFHIGAAGHEATHTAVGFQMNPGEDWASSYYRDLGFALALGITPKDVLLHHLAKATDPNSGGKQMSEHFSSKELNLIVPSSAVGAQFLPGLGLGLALQKSKQKGKIAYVSSGDGATSQGSFFEAINWASRAKAPVFFVIQDNRYAISVPTKDQTAGGTIYKAVAGFEGLARIHVDGTDFFKVYGATLVAMEYLRSGKGPVCMVADVVRLMPHSSSDNQEKYRTKEDLASDKSKDPILRFEKALLDNEVFSEEELQSIRASIAKEIDELALWGMQQPDPKPDEATKNVFFEGDLGLTYEKMSKEGSEIVLVDAINHALHEEMRRDDKVIVYGEDVAREKGGVFTATRGLTKAFGEERCFNSPLAENSIIGTAVGYSVMGYKPVVEIQFGDYIWPAMQALRNMVASFRYRSNNEWSCPMVIRVPVGGYIHGGLCHSQNIEGLFSHMPGFKIAMPSTAADAKGLLKTAIRMQDPVLFLEHKYLYRQPVAKSPEPDKDYLLPFGKARIVQEGKDITLVTYGALVYKSLSVARSLEKEGISVEIIDIRTMIPLDIDSILNSVKKTSRAIVVYEDHEFMGFGAEIASQINQKAFKNLDAPVLRVAGAFSPIAFADVLEKEILPQDVNILAGIREVLSF